MSYQETLIEQANAALGAGDIAEINLIELLWLNAYGPRPPVERDDVPYGLGAEILRALAIHKGAGSDGRTLVEWAYVDHCGFCGGIPNIDISGCPSCNGSGWDSDVWYAFYADLDGNLVRLK